jgi:hypothetical protein
MRRERILATAIAALVCAAGLSVATVGTAAAGPTANPKRMSVDATARSGASRRAVTAVVDAARRRRASAHATATAAGSAPSVSVSDPVSDDLPSLDARGDLRTVAMSYGARVTVGATVQEYDDPVNSYNWQGYALEDPDFFYGTVILWDVDVNNDLAPEYTVVFVNDGTDVVGGVTDAAGTHVLCDGLPSWKPSTRAYFMSFTRACIGSPTRVRAQGFMIYETPLDIAADLTAWTGQLTKPGTSTASVKAGYWMLGSDGHVYPFGGAVGFSGVVASASAMAPRTDGEGYWIVDRGGHVFAYGTAKFLGGAPGLTAGEFVSTISATPNGGGYWLFTNKGRAFAFGNAHAYGDMSGRHLNAPIVASVATPSGHGYYMVGSDGGIFCFGDAHFHGSTGNLDLNKPVVGISPTANGHGYWLVASDGGVFAFNAPFRGSMGGAHLNQAVDGLVAFGNGYLMAASDGGIFDFSNKPFLGSLANHPPSAPIIGLAAYSA